MAYIGKVRHNDTVYEGEHARIVTDETFARVQELLANNGQNGGRNTRNKCGALLRGLLKCAHCDCAMSHSVSTRGSKRYRCYVCVHAQKHGWSTCPAPSVSAGKIERFVVGQISRLGNDAELVKSTFQAAQRQLARQIEELQSERKLLKRQIRQDSDKSEQLATCGFRNTR